MSAVLSPSWDTDQYATDDPFALVEAFGFRSLRSPADSDPQQMRDLYRRVFVACGRLASITGLPPRAISLKGRLGLDFTATNAPGTGPGAHYNRASQTFSIQAGPPLNLAFSWLAGLDHLLGDMTRQPHGNVPPWPQGGSPFLSGKLAMYTKSGFNQGERFDILTPAMLRARLEQAPVSPVEPDLVKALMETVIATRWRGRSGQIEPTSYFNACKKAEGRKTVPYWTSPTRMLLHALTTEIARIGGASTMRGGNDVASTEIFDDRPLEPALRRVLQDGIATLQPLPSQFKTMRDHLLRWSDDPKQGPLAAVPWSPDADAADADDGPSPG